MTLFKTKKLISVDTNTKTIKGQKLGVNTGIMYLAPHNLSGFQTCPNASEGCKNSCLYTAGMGIYSTVQQARIKKTLWFFKERKTFFETIIKNIESLVRKSTKEGKISAVRLNGTSDIAWEKFKVIHNGIKYNNIMELFPTVEFYDYTKILGRKTAIALKQGYNVAVVMNVKNADEMPKIWGGYPVLNGDETDVRFKDGQGFIVALTAKGEAKRDKSGFVRTVKGGFNTLSLKVA